MTVSGIWYDGLSAQRRSARLQVAEAGAFEVLSDDGPCARAERSEITFSERLGSMPRTLQFPCGGVFETREHEALLSLLGGEPAGLGWVHWLEQRWSMALASLVLMAGLAFWSVVYGVPMAADAAARHTPQLVIDTIAQGAMTGFDEQFFAPSELPPARQQALREHFKAVGRRVGHDLHVEFRKAPIIGANAFALPDGTVVVTDEFITMTPVEQEWDAVLLHEIGHVEQRHALRGIYRSSGVFILASALLGDASSVVGQLSAMPAVLVGLAYSREFEREADDYARQRMQALGLPLVHFANAMARLEAYHCGGGEEEDASSVLSYLSTHPDSAERINAFGGSNLSHEQLPRCRFDEEEAKESGTASDEPGKSVSAP